MLFANFDLENKLKLILIEDNSDKVDINDLANKLTRDKIDTKVSIKGDSIGFVKVNKEGIRIILILSCELLIHVLEKEVRKEENGRKVWNNKNSFSSRNYNRCKL
jgi:hypothetical protein